MRALEGLKIADFSWVGAGPRATKELADNGALVVKVESAKRLDLGRKSPPFAKGERGNPDASAFFAQTNTSKKSVTINLADPQGQALAKKLVGWADVVVENFGPGYMERIGLGWAELCKVNPGVILASVSVAGRTGPMAGFRGYGNSAAAHSGHADMTGWPGSEPHMPPFAYGDVVAPMFLTVAILAALEARERTGQGSWVEVSQIEPMAHVIADLFAEMPAEKPGNADPLMDPHGVFPCAGEDAWIAIACEDETQRAALKGMLGEGELAELTADHDAFELAERLAAAGVSASPVRDGKALSEHPALRAAGHFVAVDHPVLGPSAMPAPPMEMEATPHAVGPAPCLGANNTEVFEGYLGMDRAEIDRLAANGVIA
ncbi:CaiB/BaiF CoA transferase family protein [Vannielia litorea]|uniref:CaiB/BaiF CoA transferase family protein n=1 Tax=Vannielia litorea TaxID=1217970 RepID=UPI001BCDEDE3|nr:CoA transferase [Vannielia litorea]MBS8225431.1 CoA transferase [Vannielia litorea]